MGPYSVRMKRTASRKFFKHLPGPFSVRMKQKQVKNISIISLTSIGRCWPYMVRQLGRDSEQNGHHKVTMFHQQVEVRGSPMRGYFIPGRDGTGAWCLGKKYVSFAHSAAAGKALRQVQCASPGVQHRASFCLQGLRHGVICIAPRSSLFPLGEGRAAEGRPEQEGKSKKVFGESRTQHRCLKSL